jgi:hypothetical protein
MNIYAGIPACMSLTYYMFNLSLLGQDEKLNYYIFSDNLHSGLDVNPKEESEVH